VPSPYRILDFINTDLAARELLEERVTQINRDPTYVNAICCGSGEHVDWLRARGHTVQVLDIPRGLSPVRLVAAIFRATRLFRREGYHVVHVHGCLVGVIGRVAGLLARTPHVVYQAHGYHHHDHMPKLTKWFFITVERILSPLAEKHLFQNASDVDETLRRRIAPRRKLVLVGNGIQLGRFETDRAPDTDPPVVLYVARMEAVKNHPMLFRAALSLRDRGLAFKIRLAGDGELRAEYERRVAAEGLSDHVEFLGYRTDVPDLIARASVCVLTSWLEGVPRAVIEAGAAGRAVVATDVVGTRSILEDGETGYLVPYDDANALADRLFQLLTDESLRTRMGQRARRIALERYDERVVVDRIKAVYGEVVARGA
jgi:glycosyltransferase involved in cell wall biosynthesis